jgi:hypothetical protein
MASFLQVVLSFPAVVYTVLLGAALLYWLFVLVGAARLDSHGDGLDGGGADAHGGHAGADHAGGGHDAGGDSADGGDAADHHEAGPTDGHDESAVAQLVASLKLRSAPATVVLSVLFLFSWLFCVLGMEAAASWLPIASLGIARVVLFVAAPVVALPPTSLAVRPLARVFAPPRAMAHRDLIGQVCTIRTGSVTDRFGEAMLEDGGAGLVVRVRVDVGEELKRGDQAIIVSYDEERQEFTVASMDEVSRAELKRR